MTKRIAAALLWFYAGWYAGAFVAFVLAVSPLLGPVVGVSAALIVVIDPRNIIWPIAHASKELTRS